MFYSRGEKAPSLVVCPASLVYNWGRRYRNFAPDLKVQSVVGTGSQRGIAADNKGGAIQLPDPYYVP